MEEIPCRFRYSSIFSSSIESTGMLLHSFWNSARPNTASFHIPVNKPWAKPRTKRGKYTWAQTLKDSDLSACDAAIAASRHPISTPLYPLQTPDALPKKSQHTHKKRSPRHLREGDELILVCANCTPACRHPEHPLAACAFHGNLLQPLPFCPAPL